MIQKCVLWYGRCAGNGSYGLEGKAIVFLGHVEFLWLQKIDVRIPKYSYLKAFVVKHAVKIIYIYC